MWKWHQQMVEKSDQHQLLGVQNCCITTLFPNKREKGLLKTFTKVPGLLGPGTVWMLFDVTENWNLDIVSAVVSPGVEGVWPPSNFSKRIFWSQEKPFMPSVHLNMPSVMVLMDPWGSPSKGLYRMAPQSNLFIHGNHLAGFLFYLLRILLERIGVSPATPL